MTAQEALEYLININVSFSRGNGKTRLFDAINKAIEALLKQIPKKPDYEGDGYDENGELIYDTAYCPECHHEFEYGVNDWGVEHCPCGQALDWSDSE